MEKFNQIVDNIPVISFLKNQWILFWNWIKLAHSSSDEASSKRFYGGGFILTCIIGWLLFAAGVFNIVYWNTLFAGWLIMLLAGIGLISMAVLEKITQVIADFKIAKLQNETNPTIVVSKIKAE